MNTRMRDRYLDDSLATASPAVLLVRLYERLIVDLEGAEGAVRAGDLGRTHELLVHAQDIITELHATLDVHAWSGGQALSQLYEYANHQLLQANLAKDGAAIGAVRELLAPLRDAWREAAAQPAGAAGMSLTA